MDEAKWSNWKLPLDEHPELQIKGDFASMSLVPVERGGQPRLLCPVPQDKPPRIKVKGIAGVTHVKFEIEGFKFFRDPRRAKLIFFLPDGLRARLSCDSGQIEVQRLTFEQLEIHADAGQLRLDRVEGRILVLTDAGTVDAVDISGSFDIRTDAGKVHVRALALDPGRHRVETDMGAIEVELPEDMAARVDAHADLGKTIVEVKNVLDAPIIIEAKTDLGFVRVRPFTPPTSRAPASAHPYRAPRVDPTAIELPENMPADEEDDIDRIVGLVVAGKISAEEAQQLLSELD
jgi:hypothetical protein